jgi:hypothetical protein
MASKHQVTSSTAYKKQLLSRSEVYRQNLALHGKELQHSVSWVPRTVNMAKSAAPLLALGLPLAGLLLFKRRKAAPVVPQGKQPHQRKGLLAMVLGGLELYNRFKPLMRAFAQHRDGNGAPRQRVRPGPGVAR